jgi:16S rRNA (uracil1498-N3)-methyltransferase
MSKIRVYIDPKEIKDELKVEEKEVVHKIKNVLRLKKEKKIYIFDGEGKEYLYKIKDIKKNYLFLIKENLIREENPSSQKLILGFPLFREEKIDFILQKCTELGVDKFCPFICERSIRKRPSSLKLKRWQKIVKEATRQSNRVWLPELDTIREFKELTKLKFSLKLVASLEANYLEGSLKEKKEILLIVGPEGDFANHEYKILKDNNFIFFKLSPYTLRTVTAAIFSVGLIKYLCR